MGIRRIGEAEPTGLFRASGSRLSTLRVESSTSADKRHSARNAGGLSPGTVRWATALAAVLLTASADVRADEKLFHAHGCASCHRVGKRGGDAGPDLSFVGLRRPAAWIEAWLADPRAWKKEARMPDPALKEADRKALAAWLSTRKGQDHRPFKDGKAVYLKAGCVACHGPGGKGGEPNPGVAGGRIPALRETVHTYSLDELKRKIAEGSVPAGKDPIAMPAWRDALSPAEIESVSRYLLSLRPSQRQDSW